MGTHETVMRSAIAGITPSDKSLPYGEDIFTYLKYIQNIA